MVGNSDIIAAEASNSASTEVLTEAADKDLPFWQLKSVLRLRRLLSKIVYRIDRIFGDLVAISFGLAIAGLWMATAVLEKQSTDLTALRPNIKMWFADAFQGRDAEFGRLEVAWHPSDSHFVVTIEDAEIRDEGGALLERFDLVRTTLKPGETLTSRPRLINAQIRGGVLSYIEDADGNITAGLGPPETVGRIGPAYRSGETRTESRNFNNVIQGIEFIQINDAKIHIQNDVSGIDLVSEIAQLQVHFSEIGDMSMTARGTVEQISEKMPFEISTIADANFGTTKFRIAVQGAQPSEIAPTKGRFWELQGLDASVDLTADIDYSQAAGLQAASVDLNISPGSFTLLRALKPRVYDFNSLRTRAALAPGDERMDVEFLNLSAPKLSFKSSGFLTELGNLSDGDVNSSPIFNLALRDLNVDMTPEFESEIRVKGLNLIGQADVDSRRLDISTGELRVFETVHNFAGSIVLEDNNALKTVNFDSNMTGIMKPDEFLSLWPVQSFDGARRWIERSVIDGNITQLEAEIAFDEAFFGDRLLTEERLKLQWAGDNTSVRYIETMPPATDLIGRGQIIGNQLTMSLESGRVDGMVLTGGTIEIPRLLPKGGDIIINATGRGEASELMRLADFPPFQIASRYSVDPMRIAGSGDVSVQVTRPLLEFFPRERIRYEIKGDFINAKAPFNIGQYEITNGTVSMEANNERVIMTGPVDIGPWRADMQWQETFGLEAPLAQYGVSGAITAEVLDELGFGSRSWFDGSAELEMRAEGRGMDISGAQLNLDLTDSELSVERIWMKARGEPAQLTGQLRRGVDNSFIIENAKLMGSGIDVGGRVELSSDYKVREIDLSKMIIESLIDGAVKITPDRVAGRLGIVLDADVLDVSPWTEDLFAERQSDIDVPLTLEGQVQELILDEFYPVTDSAIYFSHTGEVIETARLEALSDGKPLKLELSTRENLKRQFAVKVPDASKAVSAFMGLDNTSGGELEIIANLPAAGEEGAYVGEADMRDFKLKEAPALAQLLSLASLTGLADTLTGGSMQFDRFKLPFTMLGDDIAIRDARLYGPALGMTGNGDIDLDLRVLDFDGTLVPAYSANSILGDIPVLGDLFVQEKDGGLFALTYTVSGPFEQTQIAVNPLSALTPGFLRGIFKRDRSEADEAMKEAIEDVLPKEPTELESP